ncbi:pilus assembly protein PilP [Pseudomonas sp. MSSRFD41]|uniref:pilus assembly protein PilP n=1 Tax=unclassified Pseudomonas TaxID=196821 RepID=UPI001639DA61|nr:pilus assembly protein PilP [Pseudomonas sp. MSSRFD41]MBC2654718.1 pilus assembly protein PilP [Pseudomonas sp. MSSRFD41]
MRGVRWLLPGAIWAGLLGCGPDAGFSDLDAYLETLREQAAIRIEPAPAIRAFPALGYGAGALRSPFQAPLATSLAGRRSTAGGPEPDRVRGPLEAFDIEQLQMVGTLSGNAGSFVLLRAGDAVHRLRVGDYLGRDQGRIVAIDESWVKVLEIVPDGSGSWLERPRTLVLKSHS